MRPFFRMPTLILALLFSTKAGAQNLPVVPVSSYSGIETLLAPVLSPKASWISYSSRRMAGSGDSSRVLYLYRQNPDTSIRLDWAQNAVFSPDERWVVWQSLVSDAERVKLTAARKPVRNGVRYMNLATLQTDSLDQVAAYGFDASGKYLLLERYPTSDTADHKLVLVIELASGRRTSIGSVADWLWSDRGSMLALTLGTKDGGPGGLQLFDATTATLKPLGSSGASYRQTRWRKNSFDMVSLRAEEARALAGTRHVAEVWRNLDREVPEHKVLEDSATDIPDSMIIVAHSAPVWSENGGRVQLGLRPKPVEPDSASKARKDTLPGVQIWHTKDVSIYPAQQLQAAAQSRRSIPLIWDLRSGSVNMLNVSLRENTEFLGDWSKAYVTSDEEYPWGAMFGRRYHDGFLVDVSTGERSKVLDSVRYSSTSPNGRYVLAFDGKHYHATDIRNGSKVNITSGINTEFGNTDSDTPSDLNAPFGRSGWLDNDAAVLLYDEYDVWLVRPDGSGGSRLTRGAEDSVVHRVVNLSPERRTLDPRKPLLYSLRGMWSEKRGYAQAEIGKSVDQLVFRDKSYGYLGKADSVDVIVWREESRQDSPDFYVSDLQFRNAKQISQSNVFLSAYASGKTELIRYKNETGRDLKGVLLYPVNHDPSKKYPMIVYAYELLSQTMHTFQNLSERAYYNQARWTNEEYFVLLPDIHFRHRDPGVSLLETLRPAVGAVVARGYVDATKVGFVGHSWGGYHGAYVATHSDLFAASVAGAPLTDFLSFMGQIHWNGGTAEVDHWETGQARMEVPYWEDKEAHRRNSPIEKVESMTTPLLLVHGNKDRVVEYFQSTVLYNFARRAGKQVVFLTYEEEDHSIQKPANQIDYHRRLLEWFGHYLKGEQAPSWISDGVKFSDHENEKRRVIDKKK